jgi:multimeric flavodoxin WrbA
MKKTVLKMNVKERQKLVNAVQRKVAERSVLVLSGSTSEDGNTDAILENLMDGMQDAGFQVQSIPLRELSIAKCIDCGMCLQGFDCHLDDDMESVRLQMMKADVLIFAVHCDGHHVNGYMKKLFGRLRFFLRPERKPLLSGKKALIITTLSECNHGHETKLVSQFYEEFLSPLGIGILDMLFFDNLSLRGAIHERSDYLSEAYYAGRGLSILIRKYHMTHDLPSEVRPQKSEVS